MKRPCTSLPNPPLPPPHLQSSSLGSSFEYMIDEEVEAVVSRIRRGGQGGAGGASAAGEGGCGGGGRNWLKDYSDPGHDRPDCDHHEDKEEGAGEDDPKGDERGGVAATTGEGDGQGEEDRGCDVIEGGCRHSDLADSGGEELELDEDACKDREGGDGEGNTDEDEEGVEADVVGGGGECGTMEEEDDADSREEGEEDAGGGDGEGAAADMVDAAEVELKADEEEEEEEADAGDGVKDRGAPRREDDVKDDGGSMVSARLRTERLMQQEREGGMGPEDWETASRTRGGGMKGHKEILGQNNFFINKYALRIVEGITRYSWGP